MAAVFHAQAIQAEEARPQEVRAWFACGHLRKNEPINEMSEVRGQVQWKAVKQDKTKLDEFIGDVVKSGKGGGELLQDGGATGCTGWGVVKVAGQRCSAQHAPCAPGDFSYK